MLRGSGAYAMDEERKYKVGVSIVIPVFNEINTLRPLYDSITAVLKNEKKEYEIIFIDDGSTDGSFAGIKELSAADSRVRLIKFERNFGQTAALMAGIDAAEGEIIVTIDGDFQNMPDDIPLLLREQEKGYDLVCGWRYERKDGFFLRRIPSTLANRLISWIFKLRLHDYGCTLKAVRSKSIKSLKLYGEMHRFIPGIIAHEGGKVTEIKVKHNARAFGKSNYGLKRVLKVLFDLFLLEFMMYYSTCPIHFFGYFSVAGIGLGVIVGSFTLYQRYVTNLPGVNLLPLVLLTMFLILIGVQTILIGILAEIAIRIFYETQKGSTYCIEKVINRPK